MARFDGKKTKQRASKMLLTELSGVTRGAHDGAHATIFKTSDVKELIKISFEEALDGLNLEDDLDMIMRELFKNERALHRSIGNILSGNEEYPNPRESVMATLQAYAAAVSEAVSETQMTEKEFKKIECSYKGKSKDDEERLKRKMRKIFNVVSDTKNPAGVASTLIKESNMTEKLEKQVSDLTKQLATATKMAVMNDNQKSHYHGLDDLSKEAFLSMSPIEMQAEMVKAEAANPVVYTATDGTEFRKNADPQMVAMAKRMDETMKTNQELLEKQQTQEFVKRASEELSNLKGDDAAKVALLKAINTIEDESVRTSIGEMLKSASVTSSDIFGKIGTSEQGATDTTLAKKAQSDLDAMVNKYAADHNVGTTAAYVKVLETSEGQKLYDQTLTH